MVANQKAYSKMLGNSTQCMRTPCGNCVGNCMPRPRNNKACLRTIGGTCVGNCMPSPRNNGNVQFSW